MQCDCAGACLLHAAITHHMKREATHWLLKPQVRQRSLLHEGPRAATAPFQASLDDQQEERFLFLRAPACAIVTSKVPSNFITDQNIWCHVSARASRHGRKAKAGCEARRALARHVGLILNQTNTCTFLQLGMIFGVHPHVPFHNFAIIRACACITVHWNANVYNKTHVAIA